MVAAGERERGDGRREGVGETEVWGEGAGERERGEVEGK